MMRRDDSLTEAGRVPLERMPGDETAPDICDPLGRRPGPASGPRGDRPSFIRGLWSGARHGQGGGRNRLTVSITARE